MPNSYTVTAPGGLAIPAGMPVKLSDDQLARRRHQVREAKEKGFHVSDERMTFKNGEKIVVAGELPKNLAVLTDKPVAPSKPTEVKVDKGVAAKVIDKAKSLLGGDDK